MTPRFRTRKAERLRTPLKKEKTERKINGEEQEKVYFYIHLMTKHSNENAHQFPRAVGTDIKRGWDQRCCSQRAEGTDAMEQRGKVSL